MVGERECPSRNQNLHMRTDQFHHRVDDSPSAFVHCWMPDGAPLGIVQIVHGMAEHGARYQRLAQALTNAGYGVYAQDLPGHGRTVRSSDELGHTHDTQGWALSLMAINQVRSYIELQHPGLAYFLIGHSRGSFLLQDYLIEHGRGVSGAVFSGGSGDLGPLRLIGEQLLKAEALLYGRRHRSALADALTFKDFNRRFKPARTNFDWLSRDPAEVDAYVADPLCGFRCSCAVWLELMAVGSRLDNPKRLARIPKQLPVLLLNGSADPACRGEAGARALERIYRQAGLSDLRLNLYADARHELFNETCRDEVTQDLIAWLRARSPTQETAS